jgi:glycosyltransferase involved in cell wall biosynthesis
MSLCKAIEDANKEGMKFELSLTGWGTEKEDLEKFASQTEGRIWVNPVIPSEKVPELLAKVHVGALPFPDEEKYRVCSPVKLFEYMASGLPVLATKIVCFTDVIQDDAYTFWAENATPESLLSALRTIWDSRSNLKMMGDAAARAAHSCTWKNSAEKLDAALKIGLQGMSNEQKGQQANRIL